MKTPELNRCPFCHTLPVFEVIGNSWVGGCSTHIPNAVNQPWDMYEQVVIQWNNVVTILEQVKKVA